MYRVLTFIAVHCALVSATAAAADQPNFVWILSEDSSQHYLKLFTPSGAATPHIEKLAQDGVVFQHAFSNSPVCSVARTTLITSCYAPRIGTQHHRRSVVAPMPDGLQMFPFYLRSAGYFTTNNSKKDYNAVEDEGVWNISSDTASWRDRPDPSMPFFHMQTFTMSHESSLHFSEQEMQSERLQTSTDDVIPAPYHPDTPTLRHTLARYHDRIRMIDQAVGKLVDQLRQDQLLQDTFIFYFGDHGGVLPRSKGYLYETGLHVPLVVRIPENWRDRVALPPGSQTKGFVSFVDFGPTLLHLAGLEVPDQVDGRPFLGPDVTREELDQRDEAFGYADRFDEKSDLSRSLRKGRYKYIRNYQPFYPDALQNNYRYNMLAYSEWRQLYRDDKLNAAQRQFFEPKPVEALYDLEADPHEISNLAADPSHAERLKELRARLHQWVTELPDLSFYPESYLVAHALDAPVPFGQKHADEIARLVHVADLSLLPFADAHPKLKEALMADNPWVRYWGLTACCCFGEEAKPLVETARELLDDPERLVRVRAAEFLAMADGQDPRPTIYEALRSSDSPVEAALILNSAVFVNDHFDDRYPLDPRQLQPQVRENEVNRRLQYLGESK